MNMLHDVFPYASRYEEEAIDDDAPNVNEPVDMSNYEKYSRLLEQAQTPVYEDCPVSVLSAIMSQMHLKVKHRTSNGHYGDYSKFIKTLLPPINRLPESQYKTKKILGDLGLDCVKIHACKNNCGLFYGDYKDAIYCPICNGPRYDEDASSDKGKPVPVKVLRYFSLTPRLQRLYMLSKTAEEMRWHSLPREDDGVLRHPSDGEAWKSFDASFPDFAEDVRNVRFGLTTDGFNPSGNMTLSHSIWPVILMPYNLPPWMCMKKEYNFLVLLIPGPNSSGKCLDVYLRPLIDELKELWENGIPTFDRHSKTSFRMRTVVMWTISNFPGYGMLSSHTTQGYKACPICLENVDASRHADRIIYLVHRRWLPMNHEWRLDADAFDGREEHREPPPIQSRDEILYKLNSFDFGYLSSDKDVLAQNLVRPAALDNWHHKSIFFELPYRSTLRIRHNLDVMHIEKNVCDNVVGTILDIKDKTKDSIKARDDLQKMGLRRHLWVKRTASR
ncbi:PREDICTED: uncharacterized protein LOC101297488 [Fragaria vesca subsp. vesca]|uniref:uncharacterized protein LOC101297488 n=1 Tax=Fragaria vesca subsp. vesca TaxID=101020 RepID=UPI0002C33F22|nr:PREDICTED: uncharacterized protein LOC101297488 [Fragaria vesca subsp. vesca]